MVTIDMGNTVSSGHVFHIKKSIPAKCGVPFFGN